MKLMANWEFYEGFTKDLHILGVDKLGRRVEIRLKPYNELDIKVKPSIIEIDLKGKELMK